MKKYRCVICGYIYDDAKEKIKFEDLPEDWTCPLCGSPKSAFEEIKEEDNKVPQEVKPEEEKEDEDEDLRNLSDEEIAYICSNLARACEKQYLEEEEELFKVLANHYEGKVKEKEGSLKDIKERVEKDIEKLNHVMQVATTEKDRGAKRVLTWATKTTNMMKVILDNYEKKGLDYIKDVKIWVCDICGFIYIGDTPPKVCPICKVPSMKILEVK